jgi:predicted transcriptional regulator
LQQFRGEKGTIDPKLSTVKPFSDEEIEKVRKKIEPLFKKFGVR